NNATDRMFASGTERSHFTVSHVLYALDNLYGTAPAVAWKQPLDSAVDGAAIALLPDASKVFAVSGNGTVYGFDAATGAPAAGFPVSVGHDVSWASPW